MVAKKKVVKKAAKIASNKVPKKVPEIEIEELTQILDTKKVSPKNKNRVQFGFNDKGKLYYLTIAYNNPKLIKAMNEILNGDGLTGEQSNEMGEFEEKCFKIIKKKYGFNLNTEEANVFWGHLE